MISANNLSMNFGGQQLFTDVSIRFDKGKRYGLVGANGSGKSTFLKILGNEEHPAKGEVCITNNLSLGMLSQDHFKYEQNRVIDVTIMGKQKLWDAMQEQEQLLSHEGESDGHRIAELEEIIAAEDGYSANAQAAYILAGLGIEQAKQEGPMSALSGGFKLRVLLAQVLFAKPDVLLLDEPTNHLDIYSIRWLEKFLRDEFRGTVILISHDRDFLNRVCTHIADVDFETITLYTGNYDDFLAAKDLAMDQRSREIQNQQRKIDELQAFVDRFKAKASKARQAQSRVKQIEKIDIPPLKKSSRRYPQIQFSQNRPSGKEVLTVANIAKSFGKNKVLSGVNFSVNRGEKIAIIGANGMGKSTLLKIICGVLPPDSGTWQWGYEAQVSYFAQDHHEALTEDLSVYDWLYSKHPQLGIGPIRGSLGAALFTQDEVHKNIRNISGGESARLLLANMILEKGNILILDEPTNHLDLESVEVLEDALSQFEGTVLFVSHDKQFVGSLANRILEVKDGSVNDFSGSYEEYLLASGEDHLKRDVNLKARSTKEETNTTQSAAEYYENKKNQKRELSKLKREAETLEKEISETENKVHTLEAEFSNTEALSKLNFMDINEKQSQLDKAKKELEAKIKQWEKATKKLETVSA